MSEKKITICDNCEGQRKEVNHWQTVLDSATSPHFYAFADISDAGRGAAKEDGQFLYEICSQKCATEVFQRWLNTGSILKQDAQGKMEASNEG